MSANSVSVFQEAIRQLRAMDETDSGPSRSPIPFNDSFVESFEKACKEHGLSYPLLYEQLGEPALDGGPRCILRVMDPTSDGRQLYQLRWRVGWNNWASLEERRLFRVWLREAFERAIAQVRDRSESEVTKPIPQEFIDRLGRAQAEGTCFYNFPSSQSIQTQLDKEHERLKAIMDWADERELTPDETEEVSVILQRIESLETHLNAAKKLESHIEAKPRQFDAERRPGTAFVVGNADDFRRAAKQLRADANSARHEVDEQKLTLDERAVALFVSRPTLKKTEMASMLRCHEKSLSPTRCPKLAAAIRAYRAAELPSGSKDADGNLEAWDER